MYCSRSNKILYLCKETTCTINKTLSDYINIATGVLQGTVLGSLPFLIYVNNILESCSNEKVVSYTDNTTVMFTETDWDEVLLKRAL